MDWINKVKDYLWQNGNIKNSPIYMSTNYDNLIDICFIAVVIGVLLRITGEKNLSKKLSGIGLLAALILKVCSLYV